MSKVSLNPYSIGIWSATENKKSNLTQTIFVLILILLEYGLRQQHNKCNNNKS